MTTSVGFKMVEFETQKNNTIEYEFQVDTHPILTVNCMTLLLGVIYSGIWGSIFYSKKDRFIGMMTKFL